MFTVSVLFWVWGVSILVMSIPGTMYHLGSREHKVFGVYTHACRFCSFIPYICIYIIYIYIYTYTYIHTYIYIYM